MTKYLYQDLTYAIRHCIFEVQNQVGVGFDEETYHQALIRKFKQEEIGFVSKEKIVLKHRNVLIRKFVLDFLIEDKVILSLKCLPFDFLQVNYVQLFNELKLWKKQLGLMANFGLPKVKIKKIIFTEKETQIEENYDYIKNEVSDDERNIIKHLRDVIFFVNEEHGLGFGRPIFRKITEEEFRYRKMNYETGVLIPINYNAEIVRKYKMRHFLIEKKVVFVVKALQDAVTNNDISRMKSYLKALNLRIGLVVNFGKNKLEIRAVR